MGYMYFFKRHVPYYFRPEILVQVGLILHYLQISKRSIDINLVKCKNIKITIDIGANNFYLKIL